MCSPLPARIDAIDGTGFNQSCATHGTYSERQCGNNQCQNATRRITSIYRDHHPNPCSCLTRHPHPALHSQAMLAVLSAAVVPASHARLASSKVKSWEPRAAPRVPATPIATASPKTAKAVDAVTTARTAAAEGAFYLHTWPLSKGLTCFQRRVRHNNNTYTLPGVSSTDAHRQRRRDARTARATRRFNRLVTLRFRCLTRNICAQRRVGSTHWTRYRVGRTLVDTVHHNSSQLNT